MQVRANLDPNESYSMLLLTPELQKSLQQGELVLRSEEDEGAIAACTTDHTFRLRRLNQSNNLFLSRTDDAINLFGSPEIILESLRIPGQIAWNRVPIYESNDNHKPTLEHIRQNSECSETEFNEQWRQKPGVVIDGVAYALSQSVVHKAMLQLVDAMVINGSELNLEAEKAISLVQNGYREEILQAVYNKFALEEGPGLDIEKLYAWTGSYLLANNPDGMFIYELKKLWNIELSCLGKPRMELIEGSYVETKPGFVKFFDVSRLSSLPRDRFAELFRLKSEWLLDDIAPFLKDLVPATSKLESWVLKFTRRTKKGTDYYVSARRL